MTAPATAAAPRREILLALSTHWDREWYQAFEGFRHRLVAIMDAALATLEGDPRIACFHFDGQTSALEDWLEIRPEAEPRVRALAAQGRFLVGPWYTMPDLFLTSAESQLRNLEKGLAIADAFGGALREGYVCDLFGFHSQVPQLLRLAGIGSAFLFRGAGDAGGVLPRRFRWASADGAEVLCHRFTDDTYCEFFAKVRNADRSRGLPIDVEAAADRGAAWLRDSCADQPGRVALAMDGSDHADLDPQIADLVAAINKRVGWGEVRIASLADYARRMADERPAAEHRGELRFCATKVGTPNWLIQNTLSSHPKLKRWNRRVETLLTRWAEPFELCARTPGGRDDGPAFFGRAWTWLLQNHAHDSICGCSIDAVHLDMEYRFRQAETIGEEVLGAALATVAGVSAVAAPGDGIHLALFNATPAARAAVVDCVVELPAPLFQVLPNDATAKKAIQGYPHHVDGFFGESVPCLTVRDATGAEVPFQMRRVDPIGMRRELVPGGFPRVSDVERVALSIPAAFAGIGMRTFTVSPSATPRRAGPGMVVGPGAIENEHLRVAIASDGITLTDKASGRTFRDLFRLIDDGEVGDGWFHIEPVADVACWSGAPSAIEAVEDGPLVATLRATFALSLPIAVDRATNRRLAERIDVPVSIALTLRRGAVALEAEVTVDNRARDHRLRLLFPSGVTASTGWTSSACDLVERPLERAVDDREHKERLTTLPTDGVVAVRDAAGAGLAVLCPGIYESWIAGAQPVIALTLLRAFHKTVFTDGEDLCQSPGRHTWRIGLLPLTRAVGATAILDQLDALELPPRALQRAQRVDAPAVDVTWVERVVGDFRLMSCRAESGGGWTLRGYNPTDVASTVELRVRLPFARVVDADLAGTPRADGVALAVTAETVRFTLPAKRIVSLRFA